MPHNSTDVMPARALVLLDDEPSSLAGLAWAERLAKRTHVMATVNSKLTGPEVYQGATRSLRSEPKLAEVLATARAQQSPWVIMRRDIVPPAQLLRELLEGSAKSIDEEHPGFAVMLAAADLAEIRRILVVVNQSDRPISGLLAHCTELVAERTEAAVDVLLIGAATTTPDLASADKVHVDRERELYEQAISRGREVGLAVRWVTTGPTPNPWLLIADQLAHEQYDLIVDDLGDIAIGALPQSETSLSAAVGTGGVAEIPLRLLQDTDTSVLLVIDAIRLGLLSPRLAKAGAVAAAALAVLGGGLAQGGSAAANDALGDSSVPETAASGPATDAGADSPDAQGSQSAEPQQVLNNLTAATEKTTQASERRAKTNTTSRKAAKSSTVKIKKVKAPKAPTKKSVGKVKAAKADAAKDHQKAKAKLQAAKAEVAKAENAIGEAQVAAETIAVEIATAEEGLQEATTVAADMVERGTGLSSVLPSSPDAAEVQAAQAMAQEADEQLAAATEAGQEALAQLQAADADQAAASKALAEAAEQVNQTKAEYLQAKAAAAVYTETYADYVEHLRQKPVQGGYNLTARFGQSGGYWSSGYHTGLDFAAPSGTKVHAAASGKVISAGWAGAYGNRIEIKHSDGAVTTYNHLSRISVSKGDKVTSGEVIGRVGSTGNSTGSHLHFEVKVDGEFRNPASWLGM